MIIGTRGSELALFQARRVRDLLAQQGIDADIRVIRTHGDKVTDRPLRELGIQGVFTAELQEQLLAGSIDLAVHSCKDTAIHGPSGLGLMAWLEREDPADMLVIRPESHSPGSGAFPLGKGAVVGSSAVRRCRQLLARRPDLRTSDLRGNVQTRLAKLERGDYDAIFLAAAAFRRLELDLPAFVCHRLDPESFVPSPAQGALAVEMRLDHPQRDTLAAVLNEPPVQEAVRIERRVLEHFGGGCSLPLGALATREGGEWRLRAFRDGEDGSHPVWCRIDGAGDEEHIARVVSCLRGVKE